MIAFASHQPQAGEDDRPQETRAERAARLRPLVAARVAALGARAVAEATGLSESAVRAFTRDAGRTPLPGALDAYEELVADAGLGGNKSPAPPATGG